METMKRMRPGPAGGRLKDWAERQADRWFGGECDWLEDMNRWSERLALIACAAAFFWIVLPALVMIVWK